MAGPTAVKRNNKLQAPGKLQIPSHNLKTSPAGFLKVGAWDLFEAWVLEFGISLELGSWNLVLSNHGRHL
jgi:hypothetical protein